MNAEFLEEARQARDKLRQMIDGPPQSEEAVHQLIVKNPTLLAINWPHQNEAFTKLALGTQHTTDFAYAREDSPGFRWEFIEIESPWALRFTKAGEVSAALNHGIRQTVDWHAWFADQRDYVRRNFPYGKEMHAQGLADLTCTLIIGRRSNLTPQTKTLLQSLMRPGLVIMSYDTLLERSYPPRVEPGTAMRMCRYTVKGIETLVSTSAA